MCHALLLVGDLTLHKVAIKQTALSRIFKLAVNTEKSIELVKIVMAFVEVMCRADCRMGLDGDSSFKELIDEAGGLDFMD